MSAFASGNSRGAGIRNALPYYELSVEVSGPTLISIEITGDHYLELIREKHFGFLPGRFKYNVGLFAETTEITVAATPELSDATVVITPADANSTTDGHQINPAEGVETDIVITVTHGGDTETYPINPPPHSSLRWIGAKQCRAPSSCRLYRVLPVSAQRPDRGVRETNETAGPAPWGRAPKSNDNQERPGGR